MKLIFATANKGKVREAAEILGNGFELLTSAQVGITEDIPETADTFRGNSMQKASFLWERLHQNCFADDSGLEVDALGGAPGVYSARFAGDHDFESNIDKVLRLLGDREDREARFRCAVTLIIDGEPHFFDGTVEGRISYSRSGNGGFGYDPIFVPDFIPAPQAAGDQETGTRLVPNSSGLTLAEIPEDQKNLISHRGAALCAMSGWLDKNR